MTPDAAQDQKPSDESPFVLRSPTIADGGAMWRVAKDSRTLDLNTSYAYLLWARDFAATSVVTERDGEVVGFVSGYIRPDAPHTLMVWQVAVNQAFRGQKLAATMLDELAARLDSDFVETTITDDNAASMRLFSSFAERRNVPLERDPLFTRSMYPDGHDTEFLFRIGPLN